MIVYKGLHNSGFTEIETDYLRPKLFKFKSECQIPACRIDEKMFRRMVGLEWMKNLRSDSLNRHRADFMSAYQKLKIFYKTSELPVSIMGQVRRNFVFTKTKGVTPYSYLENIRIGKAKKLLEQGMPPIEAALQTGFSDQSHFTNYFNRFIGLAPGVYREIFSCFSALPWGCLHY